MVKFRSFLTASMAGVAALTGAAQAQTAKPNAAYVNAPVMNRIPDAQKGSGHCGIFETCASTKIGTGKGDIMIRLSGVGVLPQDRDSKITGSIGGSSINSALNGAHTSTTNQAMPELTVEYFITDNLSVDLIATSTRHEVSATGGSLLGNNKLDLGSAWVLPPTLTFAWHFRPHKRFNPYVGVGVTAMWFHNMHAANNGVTNKLNAGFTGGPAVNVGFDYQLVGNWFFNADVKQMFVRMHAWAESDDANESVKLRAHESLDPTVVSAGIAYRF
ncbi:MAG: OmpW family outer membrane protein [Acetobacter sp.]